MNEKMNETLRRLSNVEQALENVAIQCQGAEDLLWLKEFCEIQASLMKYTMRDIIHHGNEQ